MAQVALSVPAVNINGDNIKIVPNTFVYQPGEGEITVRAASGGGNSSESIHTSNAETKKSMVKFEVFPTLDNDRLITTWKEQIAGNVIEAVQRIPSGESITLTFPGLSITNHPERNATADGTIALEWEGEQMVRG